MRGFVAEKRGVGPPRARRRPVPGRAPAARGREAAGAPDQPPPPGPVALSSCRGRRDERVRALHQRRDRRGLVLPRPVEPASGEALGTAQLAGEAEIDRAVEAARAALDGDWGKTPANERSRLLHALADAIKANRNELSELESRNVGKAISSTKAELFGAVENFRYFASAIGSIGGRSNPIGGSLLSYTLKEPVGVAGQIVPWNYPLLMTTWKLAPALAAGCAVVLKPDPQTPRDRAAARRARGRGRLPGRRDQHRHRRRPDHRRLPRQASGGRQGRVHRLDEDGRRDHAALLGADQAPDARARAARAPTSSSPTPTSTRRSRARSGRSTTPRARAARRARASSSSSRSTTTSSPRSPRRRAS